MEEALKKIQRAALTNAPLLTKCMPDPTALRKIKTNTEKVESLIISCATHFTALTGSPIFKHICAEIQPRTRQPFQ